MTLITFYNTICVIMCVLLFRLYNEDPGTMKENDCDLFTSISMHKYKHPAI